MWLRSLFHNIVAPSSADDIIDEAEVAVNEYVQHHNVSKIEQRRIMHWRGAYLKKHTTKRKKWNSNIHKLLKKEAPLGFPDVIRPYIWMGLSEADLLLKAEDIETKYHKLLLQPTQWDNQLHLDVPRTLFDHPEFLSGSEEETYSPKQNHLYNVLKVYSLYDPYVGYTQGMNYIVGFLLTIFDSEEKVLCLMMKLFQSYGVREVFLLGFPALLERNYVFTNCVRKKKNKLFLFLRENGIEVEIFANKWFLTLFTMQFPLDFVVRVWDHFLCNGWITVYNVALALLTQMEHELLQMKSFDSIMSLILGTFETDWKGIDPDAVLIEAQKINLEKIVTKYTKKYADTKASTS